MKYLFYTENYEPGGGNRYMIDFINTIPSEQKILLCNKGALFSHNINALDNTVKIFESKKILFLLHPCYIINLFSGVYLKSLSEILNTEYILI